MRFSAIVRITSILMVALLPFTALAAETGGVMLYPQGAVLVNGVAVSRSQAGFAGDRYQTAKDSALVMSALGSSIQMGPASDVTYLNAGLRLNNGNAAVSTTNGMSSAVVNLTIRPLGQQARYQIGQSETQVVIAAHEGSLLVSDGQTERIIEPGKALVAQLEPMEFAAADAQQSSDQQPDQNKDKKKRAGGAIPGASTGVSLSKAKAVLIATLVTAGVIVLAFCLVEWCVNNNHPVSPAH